MYLFALLYFFSVALLALYGLHRLWLVHISLRRHPSVVRAVPVTWPAVCVQIPLYNERRVAERVIRAVASFDYPPELLEIQVLDDSIDDTVVKVDRVISELRAEGVNCTVIRREDRRGFKAGALKNGLLRTSAPFIAIFDADFIPPRNFLRETIPCFSCSRTAYVQTRWAHLNRTQNLLTRAQGVMLDSHFFIEHYARYLLGCCFNFNGTAGIWRKEAIIDAGNWQADTLTEDLDLSYRVHLKGWRAEYLRDLVCPAELPATLASYKAQQGRWAKGSMQVAKKILPRVMSSHLPVRARLEAFFHLTGMTGYVLLLFVTLAAMPLALWRYHTSTFGGFWVEPLLVSLTLGSLFLFFYAAVRYERRASFTDILAAFLVGIGISAHCAVSAISGLLTRGGVFVRTPKSGLTSIGDLPGDARVSFAQKGMRWKSFFSHIREYMILSYLCFAIGLTFLYSVYLVIPFLLLLMSGYLIVLFSGGGFPDKGAGTSFSMRTTSRSVS